MVAAEVAASPPSMVASHASDPVGWHISAADAKMH
jgi:hypothetical protein